MMAGVVWVALSATSVTRLMMSPGAVSMNIEATPATGRNPRAVVPMKDASWGWRSSMKTYVRRVTSAMGRHDSHSARGRQRILLRVPSLLELPESLPQGLELGPDAFVLADEVL